MNIYLGPHLILILKLKLKGPSKNWGQCELCVCVRCGQANVPAPTPECPPQSWPVAECQTQMPHYYYITQYMQANFCLKMHTVRGTTVLQSMSLTKS